MRIPLLSFAIAATLAACTQSPAPPAPVAEPAPAAPPAAPPPAPAPPAASGSLRVGLPAEGTIGFAGFGPAKFGGTAEDVRMAWGGDLGDAKPSEPGGCYMLSPQPVPDGGPVVLFMLEGDKFARIDIRSDAVTAPGGGRVGQLRTGIERVYGNRVQRQPLKYGDGFQLRIKDPAGGPGVLVFETDTQALDGKVTSWRIGVPPAIDYVEGCS